MHYTRLLIILGLFAIRQKQFLLASDQSRVYISDENGEKKVTAISFALPKKDGQMRQFNFFEPNANDYLFTVRFSEIGIIEISPSPEGKNFIVFWIRSDHKNFKGTDKVSSFDAYKTQIQKQLQREVPVLRINSSDAYEAQMENLPKRENSTLRSNLRPKQNNPTKMSYVSLNVYDFYIIKPLFQGDGSENFHHNFWFVRKKAIEKPLKDYTQEDLFKKTELIFYAEPQKNPKEYSSFFIEKMKQQRVFIYDLSIRKEIQNPKKEPKSMVKVKKEPEPEKPLPVPSASNPEKAINPKTTIKPTTATVAALGAAVALLGGAMVARRSKKERNKQNPKQKRIS